MPIIYSCPAFRRSLPIVLFGLLCLLVSPWISTGSSESTKPAASIPTASPVAGSIVPNTIRQIALNTKDLVYDPVGQRIYASLPGSVANGNSVVQIEPVAGTVGTPVFIGSEPSKLAISGNSQYIYAALDGAAAVRRFDIATQTAGLQFNLGSDSFFGPLYVDDMEVMPGQPNTIAVSRRYLSTSPRHAGVGIYDDGVVRPTTTPTHTGSNVIEFSSSASTLYGYNNETSESGFRKMTINGSGVTVTTTTQNLVGGSDIRYANGLIYSTGGKVIDPELGVAVGSFTGIGSGPLVLPDPAANQIYFLAGSGSSTILRSFNLTTFIQTGSLTISAVSGTPGSLIKWGNDGLAFRTSGNQIFLLSTTDIVPVPPTPAPSPVQVAPGVIQLPLAANDLVYDSSAQRVYASTPSSAGSFGNSLVPINPSTGITGTPVFIGSEPRKLAISTNNQYIYAGIDGANSVRRFILSSQTAELQFSLGTGQISTGPLSVDDMAVMPGVPTVVAIARRNTGFSPRHEGVAIYDNGVQRPTTTASHTGSNVIDFGTYGAKLYGYNNETTDFGFRRMIVDGAGVSIVSSTATSITGFGTDIKYDNGNVYSSTGRAINAETGGSLGTFSGANSLAFVPDSTVKRVYFVNGSGSSTTLQAFDQTTFLPVGSLPIPGVSGTPNNLIRLGPNGLAFSTSGNQIYFVQTSLIPPAAMSGSSTTISSSVNPSTFGQIVTFTAMVSSPSGTPTGSVQFQDKGVNLGSPQPLVGSSATLSSSSLTAGPHTITAEYSGDANFLKSGAELSGGQFVLPLVSINDAQTNEGQSGTKSLSFTVSLSGATTQTVTVSFATADGSATAGSDYVATSGILTFNPGELTKPVNVTINGDPTVEPDETFFVNLSSPTNAVIGKGQGNGGMLNDDGPVGSIGFSQTSYSANENTGFITVTVNRTNDLSGSATVDYATSDTNAPSTCAASNGFASSRCDFITALGTLRFAPGDNQRTFNVLINRDSYSESTETFTIALSNFSGAIPSGSSSVTVFISNSPVTPPPTNVIDDVNTFVRQHYHDFLNRESDPSGLAFWTNQLNSCGSDPQCTEVRRIDVSASFFLSIEFQQTGYLVERFYKVAYGDANGISTFGVNHQLAVPIVRFNEFLKDTQRIGQGVVVLQPGWEQLLENNKQAYALEFVQTSRFITDFPVTMTPEQFVDELNQNAGIVLSTSERTTAINLFGGAGNTSNNTARARALRQVSEDTDLYNAEYNRAFVLAQYFGYLRRNPSDAPDADYTGYDFWLTKLNQFNGNYINAEMVKAFLSSIEYRQRFGP